MAKRKINQGQYLWFKNHESEIASHCETPPVELNMLASDGGTVQFLLSAITDHSLPEVFSG